MGEQRIYVASRASIPERAEMWRRYRSQGHNIISTWIDEDGPGETEDFSKLWRRIVNEIDSCTLLVFYAQQVDFPLKGALVEVGMALANRMQVIACLPEVRLTIPTYKPVGSWLCHPSVTRNDDVEAALRGEKGWRP